MMWDFGDNAQFSVQRSRSRSPQPPSFPIPHANGPSPYSYGVPVSSSYPPPSGYPPYMTSKDYSSIPSPSHLSTPTSTSPLSTSYPPVIHVIHHSSHHHSKHKHKDKDKKKSRSKSRERETHSHSHSHQAVVYSPSQRNVPSPIAPPSPIFPPQTPLHPHHPHRQRTYSQPVKPSSYMQTKPIMIPALNHKRSYNALHKPRPSTSQQIPPPIAYSYPPHILSTPIHALSKPLHGILKPSGQPLDTPNPAFQYSRCTGRKKALCIGINYSSQPNALRGCVNDARNVRDFLVKHGYHASDILLLTDEPPKGTKEGDGWDRKMSPTREIIIRAMKWLVRGARKDDSLFFHYSGHGGQTKDLNGDEIDGWDEVIYPVDFRKAGHIIDDEMHKIMVKPLPIGCRLTGLFDSCHSGTVLDLPYIYSPHGRLKGSYVSGKARKKMATLADVITWSGCKDGQTSADTFAGGVAVGAMSYAFITTLTQNPHQTYQELLRSLRLILHPRFTQKPQVGSSHHIDTNLLFVF